jgi:hypothetical protein
MGMRQLLGYSLGLFTDTIGWRYGCYVTAIINSLLAIGGMWDCHQR